MTQTAPVNAYLRTKVLTASPEELRLLLLDGAIKFARQGREGLASRNYEASYAGISQCRNIILELINTMRPEHDPVLCERIGALYTFLYSELVTASLERDIARLDRVIELIEYERETWAMLMQQLATERAGANPAASGEAAPGEQSTLVLDA